MDEFLEDLKPGRIQIRDRWQIEMKSELFPFSHLRNNIQTQEFYFFIPNSLRINEQTYEKEQFYTDLTNLIRLKTPMFTLEELLNPDNRESPLVRIQLAFKKGGAEQEAAIRDEIKLLGNIFNSALRTCLADFVPRLDAGGAGREEFIHDFSQYLDLIQNFFSAYRKLADEVAGENGNKELSIHFGYVDDYMSLVFNDYITGFLNRIRSKESKADYEWLDKKICGILLAEKHYRRSKYHEKDMLQGAIKDDEYLLYRKALLSKFVIDPLLLKINRTSVEQRFRGLIGGFPAAIAMLLYVLLFLWQGNVFLMNSEPFILLTVVIYVLKDRLKEELRLLSHRQAAKWFSDYSTSVFSPLNGTPLGTLHESFSFVDEAKLPNEIREMRNREFHKVLEEIKRPERVIYYKKTINIKEKPKTFKGRFYGLSILFRFEIHHFLAKAEDPIQSYLELDPETYDLIRLQLPRVYHVNIIHKNSTKLPDGSLKVELLKFRLILDKRGIKRVEHV